jgi:CHAD domain-containing protein
MRIEDRVMDLPPEEGARVLALGLLAEASDAAEALARGAGDDPLHDFRVAVRRLRSALRAFRPWLEDGVTRRHERRLKKLARSTSEARDAEVQLAWLATRRDALAASRLHPGRDFVVARFESRVHAGPAAGRAAERFGRLAAKLRRRLRTFERKVDAAGDGLTFGRVLASLVGDHAGDLWGRLDAIRDAADEERVHEARIAGKRLRYLLEPLRGSRSADAAQAIRHLKRLQDLLGDLHDAHVLAGELRDALVEAAGHRARQLHAASYGEAATGGAIRDALRASPLPGLLALVRLVRERRDALHAALDREWRAGGLDELAAEARALAARIEARAGSVGGRRSFGNGGAPPRVTALPPESHH